ncbi:MAG: hypothetical protein H6719_17350 [Sandaracinaceae bacterium]|nr:hypothetical protein [Sandaracinaceae bacterium]
MKREAWRDWRQVAETFVAERPPRDPQLIVEVLVLVLAEARSWGDFLGGSWVLLATSRVFVADVPGFGSARTLQLLDRLVDWLARRGDVDDWQRDVLWTAIDESRDGHGMPRKHGEGVQECVLYTHGLAHLGAELAAASRAADPRLAAAPALVARALDQQLGEGRATPAGSLDVGLWIASLMDLQGHLRGADGDTVRRVADFYRWLGATGRLEPTRAISIAGALDMAELCVVSAPAMAPARRAASN